MDCSLFFCPRKRKSGEWDANLPWTLRSMERALLKKKKEQTGKNTTEIFKSAIYFTGVDETFVDNLISNIGVLASNNDIEGIKEEVQRYVAYRTCQK